MRCTCAKPKVFHITEIADDKSVQSLDLCEDCMRKYMGAAAKEQPEPEPEHITPAEFVKSVFDLLHTFQKAAKGGQEAAKVKMPMCPKCGITLEEVKRGGRFGCPECYNYLAPPQLIQNLHGSVQHVGKVPKRWKEEQEKKKRQKRKEIPTDFRIKGLEIKMNLAAKKDDFELAGQIKKALEELREIEEDIDSVRCSIKDAAANREKERQEHLLKMLQELEDRFFEVEETAMASEPSQSSSEGQ